MKTFLITVAGVFAGMALFLFVAVIAIASAIGIAARPAPLPARVVLSLDLRHGLTDQTPQTPFAFLTGSGQSVLDIEQALRRAASDPRVKGLFVRLPDAGIAPAAAEELRGAFQVFRAAGKPILAYSQGLAEAGSAVPAYALATASGDLWMQEGSSFEATGIGRGELFFKRFFDRHGVVADFQQRWQFKNAVNPFLYSDYTPAHRLADTSWMSAVYAQALAEAAADRRLAPAALRAAIEAGPYSAEDALSHRLIDHVGDLQTAEKTILASAGDGARFAPLERYGSTWRDEGPGDAPVLAVVMGEGDIVAGSGGAPSPLGGGQTMRADEIARALWRAARNDRVKAIVFRLSSPGGEDTASEEIAQAVKGAVAAGKPVVVSMGAYGASGAYWAAAGASRIVAQPSTLTGSIGVFGGKFALGPALARFGVDSDEIDLGGPFTGAYSDTRPMTAAQQAAYAQVLDRVYGLFLVRVAQGRRMSLARVGEIARGRVWTGGQARSLGLVDSLGGFYAAVDQAKALARISGEARLVAFNGRPPPLLQLRSLLDDGLETLGAAAALAEDPAARQTLAALADLRARAEGADVLASTPF